MWLRELVSLPFATPSSIYLRPLPISFLSTFFFFLAILNRVLLCKLLSDHDNQINRPKRSSDKVNPYDRPDRFLCLSHSPRSRHRGRKINSFDNALRSRFRLVPDHFSTLSAGMIRCLFRVCAARSPWSGFSNGRERERISHHYVNYCVISTRRHPYVVIAIIKLIGLNICRSTVLCPVRRIENGRAKAEPDRLRFGRLYFSLFFLIGPARSRRRSATGKKKRE